MSFSSPVFIFLFLPFFLTIYLLLRFFRKFSISNWLLIIASLLFYAWGEPIYVLLMIFSIIVNYLLGTIISANHGSNKKIYLWIGISINLLLLFFFKYTFFVLSSLWFLDGTLLTGYKSLQLHLPLGISFYTFLVISFLVDVYRGDIDKKQSLSTVALYIVFFPKVISGPIVRFKDFAVQMANRKLFDMELFTSGIRVFIIGFSKKMIFANTFGSLADNIFSIPHNDLPSSVAWLGIISYAMQLYFDFAGYSEMAIGLGKMIGFELPINFNYPYISKSIREFWRRWHITLSSWFRDYIYIPLGGSKVSNWKIYRNLLIVFFVTGIWHGANWNYIIWGMIHGICIVFERGLIGKFLDRYNILAHTYLLFIVLISWVFFRFENLSAAIYYLRILLGFDGAKASIYNVFLYFDLRTSIIFISGLLLCTPIIPRIRQQITKLNILKKYRYLYDPSVSLVYLCLFILSLSILAASTYTPFIYFKF